jgi:hypothetical protein
MVKFIVTLLASIVVTVVLFAVGISLLSSPYIYNYAYDGYLSPSARLGVPGPYRVISFSLFGSKSRYTTGMIQNAKIASENFPGWILRVYLDIKSVPRKIVDELASHKNLEIVPVSLPGNMRSKMWRFAAALARPPHRDARRPDVVICRDADSRTDSRDAFAVKAFLASDKDFHIIRDHAHHMCGRPILAGLWGCRGKWIGNEQLERQFAARAVTDENAVQGYTVDESYLMNWVYPKVRADSFISVSNRDYLWPGEILGQLLPVTHNGFLGQVVFV